MFVAASKRFAGYKDFLTAARVPGFRFNQIIDAIFKQQKGRFDDMGLLPVSLRDQLKEKFGNDILSLSNISLDHSQQVEKAMFSISSGHNIETVLMKFHSGSQSLCISSQSGCALACNFCATGAIGFKRNLTADEIVDQVLYFKLKNDTIDNITFMGMGEPLQNPNCFKALQLLTDPKLFNMSPRRLTVSTVGIIPGIKRLTKEFPQVNLAFSLHSPFEEERNHLVPINKSHPFPEVFEALDEHIFETNRKIFVAYLVLDGHNDTLEHAKGVADWVVHKRPKEIRHLYHINLLRMNPITIGDGQKYTRTEDANIHRFSDMLQDFGVKHLTVRHPFGVDMDAACGQLYANYEAKQLRKFTK